jgi:hypothetical protein
MHKTRIQLLGAAIALSTLSGLPLRAQGTIIIPKSTDRSSRVGTRGANFLEIGIGARPQAMGGASIASIEGPAALFLNPANIAGRESISAFASYMQLYGNSGITNTAVAVTLPVGAGALGFGVQQFSSGDIERTTERAPTGNDPVFPGTFAWTGTAFSLHYARNITDRLTAAVGGRFAQEGIDFAKASYVGFDFSTKFRTGLYGLSVGASLANVGTTARFKGAGVDRVLNSAGSQARFSGLPTGRVIPVTFTLRDAQMPTTFRLGLLSDLYGGSESLLGASAKHALSAEFSINDAVDTDLQSAVGVEYAYRKGLYARAGKRFFNEQNAPWQFKDGFTFGGGVKLPLLGRKLAIDYAYVTMGQLQNNQVFSFDFGF